MLAYTNRLLLAGSLACSIFCFASISAALADPPFGPPPGDTPIGPPPGDAPIGPPPEPQTDPAPAVQPHTPAATPTTTAAPAQPSAPMVSIPPDEAIQKAKIEIERKRYGDAKLVLKQSLAANPNSVPLNLELFEASVKANDWSDASQSLEKVMEIEPAKEKDVYSDYGYTLYKLKRYDKAKIVYAKALGYGKDKDAIHKTLIQIAIQEKDMPAAISEYKEYLKVKPTDGDMHWEFANFLYRDKRLKEAMPEYKLAAQYRPNDSYGHAFLAQLMLVDRDFDGAVAEYTKAIQTKAGEPGPLREALKYARQQQKLANPQPKQ